MFADLGDDVAAGLLDRKPSGIDIAFWNHRKHLVENLAELFAEFRMGEDVEVVALDALENLVAHIHRIHSRSVHFRQLLHESLIDRPDVGRQMCWANPLAFVDVRVDETRAEH